MTLSASAERSLQLADELDARLSSLRRCLGERGGDASATRAPAAHAAETVRELGALEPPLGDVLPATAAQLARHASGPPGSSAQRAGALTEELWSSLSQLKRTLEPPPIIVSLAAASEPEPEPEPEQEPAAVLPPPFVWPDTPEAEVCRSIVEASELLTPLVCCSLHALLPLAQQVGDWTLRFSSAKHGSSLATLLRNCHGQGPSYLVVRDTRGSTFGGFASTSWSSETPAGAWSGNGQCFLWSVDTRAAAAEAGAEAGAEVVKFGWTRHTNQFVWAASDAIGFGGGGQYGLWIDAALAKGTTGTCSTFGNPSLCEVGKAESQAASFSIAKIEVWSISD